MNFKKTIAKTLVAAMAIGSVSVANLQSAKAAVGAITVSGKTGIATAADAKYWSVLKEVKSEKQGFGIGGKFYTTVSVEDYVTEVDIASALKGKAGIIGFGEKPVIGADWKVQPVGVADSTFKVSLVATTSAVKGITPAKALGGEYGYLVGTTGKGASLKEVDWAASRTAIEVKQGDGAWATVADYFKITGGSTDIAQTPVDMNKKLQMLSQSGSTLSFRLVEDGTVFPSKEVKVKVAAPAKAPNVKVDVTKGTTGVKAGIEYLVLDNTTIPSPAGWKTTNNKKGLTLLELGIDGSALKVLAVRTAAKGNKIASKVGFITLNAGVAAPALSFGAVGTGASVAVGAGTGAGKLEVTPTVLYNVEKGASITNSSTNTDLEFALVPDGTTADKVKWTALKSTKDAAKPTKAALKYSAEPKVGAYTLNGKVKLYVRVAGTKQDKNNVATLAGVSVGAVVSFKNVAQNITGTLGDLNNVTAGTTATGPSIKLGATGTAVVASFTATLSNIQKSGVAPKVKVTAPVAGVTVKAEKVDATGKVKVIINVAKTAFKTDEAITAANNAKLKFDFQIEGLKDSFAIGFAK